MAGYNVWREINEEANREMKYMAVAGCHES